jgi:predicted Rossmann fold nucleotide-binding protein DprA/Smf involved in DNA uptake
MAFLSSSPLRGAAPAPTAAVACPLGCAGYPARLAERLAPPPGLVWLAGARGPLSHPACAVVGTRRTSARLLRAAWELGRALSLEGVAVVSGLARGADALAHAGALQGWAGTVCVPACGLNRVHAPYADHPRAALVGLAPPTAPFSAGLAVRRNALIAALGDGLVLVASDLRGGSAYAVRWALNRGAPVWCFEDGPATPPANRLLLARGVARPLSLDAPAASWAAAVAPALAAHARRLTLAARNAPDQLTLFEPSGGCAAA